MATSFLSIVSAVVALLQAGTPVSQHIHRARVRPAAQEWGDMVAVRLLDAQLERFAVKDAPFNVGTTLAVECYARGAAGVSPDLAVDALLEAVYERLAADPSLGGLVQDLEPTGINIDLDVDGESIACATLTYTARHRADRLTLE